MAYTRTADGQVLTAAQINELQQGLETVETEVDTLTPTKKLYFWEGTVATAASTVAKTVTITGFTTPAAGDLLRLVFTLGTTAASPTLSINGGAAVALRLGSAASTAVSLSVGTNGSAMFVFDGTSWQQFGAVRTTDTDTNTTYSTLTQAQVEDSANVIAGTVTGQRLAQAVLAHAPVKTADIANFQTNNFVDMTLGPYQMSNLASGFTDWTLALLPPAQNTGKMPAAGRVIGITARVSEKPTSGSLVVNAGGSPIVTFTSASNFDEAVMTLTGPTFAAGALINPSVTTTGLAPTTIDITAFVIVRLTLP